MSISQIKSIGKSLQAFFIILNVTYITPIYSTNHSLPEEKREISTSAISTSALYELAKDTKHSEDDAPDEDLMQPTFNVINSLTWDQIKNLQFLYKDFKYFYEIFNTIITEDIDIPKITNEEEAVIKYIVQSISEHPFNIKSLPFYQDSNMINIIDEEMWPKVTNISCRSEYKEVFWTEDHSITQDATKTAEILIENSITTAAQTVLKKVKEYYNERKMQDLSTKTEEILIKNLISHLVKNSVFFEARRLMTIEILYEKLFDYIKEKFCNNSYPYTQTVLYVNRLLETPLCLAATKGRVAIMEFFISKGVSPQCKRCIFITDDDEERENASFSPYEHAVETYEDMIKGLTCNDKTYIDINKVVALLNKHNATPLISNKIEKLENKIQKLEKEAKTLGELLNGKQKLPKHHLINRKRLEKLLKNKQQLQKCYTTYSRILKEQLNNMLEDTPVIYPSGLSLDILRAVWSCSLTNEQIKILKSLDAKSPIYVMQHTHL